ncbi:PucR family transcriptional regulator [Planosporangium thailandense]|uniref:PucR family transcriptional regulator n=1 Tax=Planosporangium thailandense TaxID=765197 RepID=A0ABX0Y1M2_9ACTN|nr:PucR family transcriptional regulator [Planosporangium thailandense]NJC71318.1 PucR family transcriptional regulator [Planosporangium thailandense]
MMSLREVLSHPSLAPADPVVRTGDESLGQFVRWVHSSEVLEIAPLLQGGELLLTGGVVLASCDQSRRRQYVRELAARGVTGVAIETGSHLPGIPAELIAEAAALRFPVIELQRVVPFVAVTEDINGALINDSVRRLRAADSLLHALSGELMRGGGPQELLDVLARALACDALLLDGAGRVLGSTSPEPDPENAGRLLAESGGWSVPVIAHGMRIARLVVKPGADTDPTVLDAALDRAPEAFGLALIRTGVVPPEDRAVRELLRLLRAPQPDPERVTRMAHALRLADSASAVGVVAQSSGDVRGIGTVDAILRRRKRRVFTNVVDGELVGIVVLSRTDRARLITDLNDPSLSGRVRLGVGPIVQGLHRLAHTLAEAQRCLSLADEFAWPERVVDAEAVGVETLLERVGPTAVLRDFVEDHLGGVLALGPDRAKTLVTTLEAYFRTGCSKTEAARQLHLHRQALYQRLTRAFEALGGDPTGTPRAASVHLAARLYISGVVDTARLNGRS